MNYIIALRMCIVKNKHEKVEHFREIKNNGVESHKS